MIKSMRRRNNGRRRGRCNSKRRSRNQGRRIRIMYMNNNRRINSRKGKGVARAKRVGK